MIFSLSIPAAAAHDENSFRITSADISSADLEFIEKVVEVSEYWYIDQDNYLRLSLSKQELLSQYGFTNSQYNRLSTIIGKPIYSSDTAIPMPMLHVEGAAVYFDNADLHALLLGAATAGPAALAAAITALSTAVGGLAGTALGAIVAALSAPSLIEICGKVITAAGTGRGVYIGLQLDYPPIVCDYW